VPVDIRCVEGDDDSDGGGVHLIPVVWKKRLFLFWPEFFPLKKRSYDTSKSIRETAEEPASSLEAADYFQIKLAWSENIEGNWDPKKVSEKALVIDKSSRHHNYKQGDFLLTPFIGAESQGLVVTVTKGLGDKSLLGLFALSDIQSSVRSRTQTEFNVLAFMISPDTPDFNIKSIFNEWDTIQPIHNLALQLQEVVGTEAAKDYYYNRLEASSSLEIDGNIYLDCCSAYKLLSIRNNMGLDISPLSPFFFSDNYRTYFVHLSSVFISNDNTSTLIKNPEGFKPLFASSFGTNGAMVSDDNFGRFAAEGVMPLFRCGTLPMRKMDSISSIGAAFSSNEARIIGWNLLHVNICLEFHTFYHPFSSKFVTRLNQGGIPALMASDTEDPYDDAIKSDDGQTFEETYEPNITYGHVKRHSDFETPPDPRTAYKENVCFDVYGANSLYNWELFYHAPLYIAIRLSKNGKYAEAMKWFHYIFDPTTHEMPGPFDNTETSRYWKVLPFKKEPVENLEDWFRELSIGNGQHFKNAVDEWRNDPFNPHLIASNRLLAYMKFTVIKYVENLIDWGDFLFRQFTRESVNEALQVYEIANHILGPRPAFIPKRGEIKTESYNSLRGKWDAFSNAFVELENLFPYSGDITADSASTGPNLLGIGPALYFCIPSNEKLLGYWDTVADRLFKIRHCQDIDGVERKLALFMPPISPETLIQAVSQGLSLGNILDDLSSPPPIYRFTYILQKANEFCADVKGLGSMLLSVLEKKDAEELSRMRALHESNILEEITATKERQLLEAEENRENLLKARETTKLRFEHYRDLLGLGNVECPEVPTTPDQLTKDSLLPADTNIVKLETNVDVSLMSGDNVKLIPKEREERSKHAKSMVWQGMTSNMEAIAGAMNFIPTFSIQLKPFGIGSTMSFGGSNIAGGMSGLAKIPQGIGNILAQESTMAAKNAAFIRRIQEWKLQGNLAAKEIIQLDKQICSADIRIQIAEKDLESHKKQIENTKSIERFLKNKFSNQELYHWMKEQLFAVYKQSYNIAYDMAKKAEKAYQYELGSETASFIHYGYWDNSKEGLVSGEKLQLALRQMEKAYLDGNRRELEINKSISLALLNPLALIELKETGKCYVSLPEEIFDLDFPGHYFRRIKSASLSIPCIAGPYTSVNCTLRLLKNTVRINTAMGVNDYPHNNENGFWTDDDRFHTKFVPVSSIAASTGQNDSGMFEFSFRDERYLPFEGAGVISDWTIELSMEKALRQFDYSTISDVILHLKYTARESGGPFKEKAATHIKNFIMNTAGSFDQPLMRMFSMKHEFPTEWHRFLHPSTEGAEQVLNFTISKERFPFFAQDRTIIVMKIDVFAKCSREDDNYNYDMMLSYIMNDETSVTFSEEIAMPQNDSYGGLNKATINESDAGLTLQEIDITKEMSLKVKHNTSSGFAGLATNPDEVKDIFLVVHYRFT
jgi:hypothetical protein